jgi:ribosomal protein L7Ae-like RNA K-turn-binding protein
MSGKKRKETTSETPPPAKKAKVSGGDGAKKQTPPSSGNGGKKAGVIDKNAPTMRNIVNKVAKKKTFKLTYECPLVPKWPALNESESSKVVDVLKQHFESLKRTSKARANGKKKPKKHRQQKKQESEEKKSETQQSEQQHIKKAEGTKQQAGAGAEKADGADVEKKKTKKKKKKSKSAKDKEAGEREKQPQKPSITPLRSVLMGIGINAVTKLVEKDEAVIVIVVKNLSPSILTAHFPALLSVRKVPCISLNKSPVELGEIFGLRSAAAVAIKVSQFLSQRFSFY